MIARTSTALDTNSSSPSPLLAELLKLRRSQPLLVVIGLPLVVTGTGIINTLFSGRGLEDGWNTLWLRTVGFHGLFPLVLGVAILASLVWRPEHRDSNWNTLMTSPIGATRIALVKTLAIAGLAAAMQATMLIVVVATGKVLFALPGLPPANLLASGTLVAVACVPLAAFQSSISMLMRSFAGAVALAATLAGVSVSLLTAKIGSISYTLPHALATRTALLGSGMFSDPSHPDMTTFGGIATTAIILTLLIVASTGRILKCRDLYT